MSGNATISVILGASEAMYRLGVRAACNTAGLVVVAETGDCRDLLARQAVVTPAVAIVELAILGTEPEAAVLHMSGRHRVLLLTSVPVDKPRMLRAGASGFLPRTIDVRGLCGAVVAAHAGDIVFGDRTPSAAGNVAATKTASPALTERETQVLRLLAEGHSSEATARDLHIGLTTVKAHLRNASGKLGARSRTAAAVKASRMGLLN